MKFLVFIKQVPDSSDIRFDPETKTLIRQGMKNIVNPYDRRAISEAIRRRNEVGGEVIVATMGPRQAREALVEAIVMGADRGVHIEDKRLAGSDTLATSRILAAAAKKIGFDILFVGQASTDSETGQVGPEVAELLDIPCAAAVNKLEYREGSVIATCETDQGFSVLELPVPCLLSAAERLIKPIKVKDVNFSTYETDKIETLPLESLDVDVKAIGLDGSPTWVSEIFEQKIKRAPQIWNSSDHQNTPERILEILSKQNERAHFAITAGNPSPGERQFWCFIEMSEDNIRPVSLELLGQAAAMAQSGGAEVCAIVFGAPLNSSQIQTLSSFGADKIYYFTSTILHPDEIVTVLCERIRVQNPFLFLVPATSLGRLVAPRVAGRLKIGLTGDCVGLDMDDKGMLVQLKPAFGGNIVASIYSRTLPQMATVRPGALETRAPRIGKRIPVLAWPPPKNFVPRFKMLSSQKDDGVAAEKMDEATIVICIGAGLGQENVPLAFELAELLQGAVGATRKVVDQGWVQRQFQVGLTGRFIAPQVYLGLGVSGRYNHTIGIQKSVTVVSINQDPNAEIFKISDLGIVGDCVEITRKMIELLKTKS